MVFWFAGFLGLQQNMHSMHSMRHTRLAQSEGHSRTAVHLAAGSHCCPPGVCAISGNG
jgi:hypothetical protein